MVFNEAVAAEVMFGESTRQAAAASASPALFPTMPTTTTGDVQQQRQAAAQQPIDPAKVMFPNMVEVEVEVDPQEPVVDDQQDAEVQAFVAPDGKQFDPEVLTTFGNVVGELGIAHDQAQTILDRVAPVIEQRQQAAVAQVRESWVAATKSDPEIGGVRLDNTVRGARELLDAYGTERLTTLLNDSGLGNHPEVIRVFARLSRALARAEGR